jgi:hypothetical protein
MLYADAFLANDDSLFTAQEQAEAARKKQPKVKIDFEKQLAVTQAREAALEAAGGQRAARAEDEEGEDGAAARAGGAYSSFLAYRELGKAATTLRELYAKAADIQVGINTSRNRRVCCCTGVVDRIVGWLAGTHATGPSIAQAAKQGHLHPQSAQHTSNTPIITSNAASSRPLALPYCHLYVTHPAHTVLLFGARRYSCPPPMRRR